MIVRSNIAVSKQYVLFLHPAEHANSKCLFCVYLREMKGSFFVQRCRRRGKKVDSFNSYYDFGGRGGRAVKERIAVNKGLESSR